jgi:hypothetical protein
MGAVAIDELTSRLEFGADSVILKISEFKLSRS